MLYGERGELMRGRMTADDQPVDPKVVAKRALLTFAAEKYELSWSIGQFSGRDRWALKWYHTELSEKIPGAITITDTDTDVDVMTYAKSGVDWHSVCLEYFWRGEWHIFRPQEALTQWLSANDNRWDQAKGMPSRETDW